MSRRLLPGTEYPKVNQDGGLQLSADIVVQDYMKYFGDRTLFTGGAISDAGSGVATIASLTAWCKVTDSDTAIGKFFSFAGANTSTLTDMTAHYIYVDYNDGVPQLVTATSVTTYGLKQDHVLIGVVFRNGATLHIHQTIPAAIGRANKADMHHREEYGAHRVSGVVTSNTGLALSITAGIIYIGNCRHTSTVNGSTWSTWYRTNGVWTEVTSQTAIDNAQYNKTDEGLVNFTANRYGTFFVYVDYDGSNLHLVYGTGNVVINEAEEAGVPATLPNVVTNYGILIAKIIVQQGQTVLTITYPWTTVFTSTFATDHGSLGGLGDDDHSIYALDTDLTTHADLTTGTHGVGAGTISSVSTANKSIYVNLEASGAADGTSYTDGFTTIQDAVDSMEDVIIHAYTIYVRAGAKKTGTADEDEANKLHDADASFASGDVGKAVFNITDGTWGRVAAFVNSGELTLDADTFPDGNEAYVIIGTPYRETVYLNSLPATYPAHSIKGSVTIRAEHYWYGDCDAQVNAGEILDATADFTNVEVGDRVVVQDMNGANGRCQDYEIGTVDDISQVGSDIVRTTLTKTPAANWKYWIVKTEISGSDDGTDGGTARNHLFLIYGMKNVSLYGLYGTFSDSNCLVAALFAQVTVYASVFENCDDGLITSAQSSLAALYVYSVGSSSFRAYDSSALVAWYVVANAATYGFWIYGATSADLRQLYIDNTTQGIRSHRFSYVYLLRGTIESSVTTGIYARFNTAVEQVYTINSATTPEDPVGTSEGAYIG